MADEKRPSYTPLIYWVGLTLIYLLTRLPKLLLLPPFNDEAYYLRQTQLVSQSLSNFWVTFFSEGKQPLFVWASALVTPLVEDPLLATRLTAVLFGMLAMWGVLLLGKELWGDKHPYAHYLAGFFYLANPYTLFHDRLGIYEPLISALAVFVFFVSYRFVKDGKLIHGIALALLFGLSLITKAYCLFFASFPFFLLVEKWVATKKRPSKKLVGGIFGALAAGWLIKFLVNLYPRMTFGKQAVEQLGIYLLQDREDAWHTFGLNIKHAAAIFFDYIGVPITLLFLIFLGIALIRPGKGKWGLSLAVLGGIASEIVLAYAIFARYLYFIFPFIALGATYALIKMVELISQLQNGRLAGKVIHLSVIALVALQFFFFALPLYRSPEKASLHSLDRWQHVDGWPSGYGLKETIQFLESQAASGPIDVFVSYGRGWAMPYDALYVYLDGHRNIRLHLAFWQQTKPLLFFMNQGASLMNPISQHLPIREKIDPKEINRVFFVANAPHDDMDTFVKLNGKPKSAKIIDRPGNKSALVVMEIPVSKND